MTAVEKDDALRVFREFSIENDLSCQEVGFPLIEDSYDTSVYSVQQCQRPDESAVIQLAVSNDEMVIELYEIGGMVESDFRARARRTLSERLIKTLSAEKVVLLTPCYADGVRRGGREELEQ